MKLPGVACVLVALATAGCKKPTPALGTVVCWGNGFSGQLGAGAEREGGPPNTVSGLDDAIGLDLGSSWSCARMKSGPPRCWGELKGLGTHDVPTPITTLGEVAEIRSSTLFDCARRSSGAVVCWGSNLVGQLGNGAAPDPATRVKLDVGSDGQVNVPAIAGGASATPVAVSGLDDATELVVGGSHACALRRGTVVCWGQDDVGQLGDGRHGYGLSSDHPVAVTGLTDVVDIAGGARATCARTKTAVWCWGSLSEQYPTDSKPPAIWTAPTKIAVAGAVEIAVTETAACARTAAGDVTCWDGTGATYARGTGHVAQLVAGARHFCARLESGSVTCWGGDNLNGQLGVRTENVANTELVPVEGVDQVIDVAAGAAHTCVVRRAN